MNDIMVLKIKKNFIPRILLYIVLIYSQMSSLPLKYNVSVFGRPLYLYFYYLIAVISIFIYLGKLINKKTTAWENFFFIGVLYSYLISLVIYQRPLASIVADSITFIFPFALYEYIERYKITFKSTIYCLSLSCLVCGILSFLVANQIISTQIWTSTTAYVRSANFIDGTCGVIGLLTCICILSNKREEYSNLLIIPGLLGAISTIIFGFSRLRIIVVAFCLCVYVFLQQRDSQGKKSNFKKVVFLLIICACAIYFVYKNQEMVNNILGMTTERFKTIGTDENSLQRIIEAKEHFNILIKTMFMGYGWGFTSEYIVGGNRVYHHLIYSGIYMYVGLIFGTGFNVYHVKMFKDSIRQYKLNQGVNSQIVLLTCVAVLLLGFGGAGITQSGGMFFITLFYSYEREALNNENRNTYLS